MLAGALDLGPAERLQLEDAAVRPPRPRLRQRRMKEGHLQTNALERPRRSIPSQLSSFVGRHEMVLEVAALLHIHRLVTLVGSGGVGKTRAALQVAENVQSAWRDGVWFVGLAPLADAALVDGAIVAALGMRESDDLSAREQLTAALRPQRLLLVLDNCEHVIGEVAATADAILRTCPHVCILATSRERLNVAAEKVYRTPSLAVPPLPDTLSTGPGLSAEEALRYSAVALFVERARAVADFNFGDADAPVVAEICRRLDGIPLAIELASVRMNALDPSGLLQHLDERFRILTRGDRAALPRQKTMRAAIDWSYDLLSEAEREVFRRLGIFAGGWTQAAAEAVCADEPGDSGRIFDLLSSLVEKSLVLVESSETGMRYRFLESTRAYALEKLDTCGERGTVAQRHGRWVAGFLEWSGDAFLLLPTSRWLPLAELEMDNARVALEWALGSEGDPLVACRIAANPPRRTTSHDAERRRWVEAALARLMDDEHPALAARLWLTLSTLSYATQNIEPAQRAATLFERAGDGVWLAVSLTSLVQGLVCAGRLAEAEAEIDRALGLLRELRLTRSPVFARALARQGEVLISLGRNAGARGLLIDSIALSDKLDDGYASYFARFTLSHLEFVEGNAGRALELLQECIEIAQRGGLPFLAGLARANVVDCRLALGEVEEATSSARDALGFVRRMRWPLQILGAIHTLGIIAARRGEVRCAARLRGYILACCRAEGYRLEPAWQRADETLTGVLRAQLTEAEIESLDAEGAMFDEDQAVDIALAV
jgi:predicted ATPase